MWCLLPLLVKCIPCKIICALQLFLRRKGPYINISVAFFIVYFFAPFTQRRRRAGGDDRKFWGFEWEIR